MTTLAALLTASQLSKYTQMTLNQKKAWDVFFPLVFHDKHQEQSSRRKATITTERQRRCVLIIGLPQEKCLQTVHLSQESEDDGVNERNG